MCPRIQKPTVLVLQHAAGDRDVHRSAVVTSTPFRVRIVGVAMYSAAFVLDEVVERKWWLELQS